jgi:hypothetical protein
MKELDYAPSTYTVEEHARASSEQRSATCCSNAVTGALSKSHLDAPFCHQQKQLQQHRFDLHCLESICFFKFQRPL